MTLDYQAQGRNGNVRLTARFPDGGSYTNKIDVANAKDREKFIRAVVKDHKGLNKKTLAAELEKIAAEVVAKVKDDDKQDDGEEKRPPSQADILVRLAENVELSHTPGGHDSKGHATMIVKD